MSDGWGDALSFTVREFYLHPDLPRWRRSGIDVLTDEQAEVVLKWRKEAARLLGYTRHLDDQLAKLLDCAEVHLESVQGELAAAFACRTTCPEFRYAGLSQRGRDLHAAVAALSRTAGPRVLLSDRVAVDLIESMTGRQYAWGDRAAITSAKRELSGHGIAVIGQYGSSRTTEYCLLLSSHTQGTIGVDHKCLVCSAPGVPDSRPELGELDRLVFAVSVDLLRAKDWSPGRAAAMARAELAERRQREAEESATVRAVVQEFDWLLEPSEPVIRYVRAADSAEARDDGSIAAAETDTDFTELIDEAAAGYQEGDGDDESPRAGRR